MTHQSEHPIRGTRHTARASQSKSSRRSTRLVALAVAALFFGAISMWPTATEATSQTSPEQDLDKMRQLLLNAPLIDGHNDVPWQVRERFNQAVGTFDFADTTGLDPAMHTDIARLKESGLGGQFWSVYIPTSMAGPGAARATLEQIDIVHRLIDKYPDRLQLALTAEDIRKSRAAGKLASLIGMEGGHSIENSLGALRQLYRAGARYMTLTHSANTDWADSATDDPAHNGLTDFGEEVVREMNRLGMLVDLSHVSPQTMHDALDATRAPVIFSHSSAFEVTKHARNVPDDVLRRMRVNGGVVMVTFVPSFIDEEVRQYSSNLRLATLAAQRRVARESAEPASSSDELEGRVEAAMEAWRLENPQPSATLEDAADHIDHLRTVAGIDHVGIGGDFDGISSVPIGLEDVTSYPSLFLELRRRGYTDRELEAIAGGNVLRVLQAAEAVAKELHDEAPSDRVFTTPTLEEASQ